MKKIFATLIALAVAATAFAGRPTGLNLGGGYGMMFYNSKTSGTLTDNSNTETFFGSFVEVGYDLRFGKLSAVYFGARFDVNFRPEYKESGTAAVFNLGTKSYFDIPVKYQIAFNVSPVTQLFFQAGPTVNFWLTNTYAHSGEVGGKYSASVREDLFDAHPNTYNRVNLSLGGTAGVYFHHVKIYAAFDAGVLNFYKTGQLGAASGYANNLRIGAAYVF